jgi:tRNA U34 2-thiouridine synthase MnmA/TrmU
MCNMNMLTHLTKLKNDKIRQLSDSNLIGLHDITRKRSSSGICFIGKRKFGDFVSQFVEAKKGAMIDVCQTHLC